LTRLRERQEPERLIAVAVAAGGSGLSLIPEDEFIASLHRIKDRKFRIEMLGKIDYNSTLYPVAVTEYKAEYKAAESLDDRAWIASRIGAIKPEHAGAAQSILAELWSEILNSDHPSISINMAGHVLQTVSDPALRLRAKHILVRCLGEVYSEEIRLLAARELGVKDPDGREAHEVLSRTAQKENNRLTAARFIGDLESLESLAENATDSRWRVLARKEMEAYGQINFLLHVGRPRRARVRFHNHEVGVLEETSAGKGTLFTYSPSYLSAPNPRPLAPNLPLRADPYEDPDTLHPFFANLLPEGPHYERTARHLGVRRADRFGVLLHVGGDVMGAVEVLPEEKP
jgi:HipA-like protein